MITIRSMALAAVGMGLTVSLVAAVAPPVPAHDLGRGPGGHKGPAHGAVALTPAQLAGVTAARRSYIVSVSTAERAYRTAVTDIRGDVEDQLAEPRLALSLAEDALEVARRYGGDVSAAQASVDAAAQAYRGAFASAQDDARGRYSQARAALDAALEQARTAYSAAVTSLLPAGEVPRELLVPPGFGHRHQHHPGRGIGHGLHHEDAHSAMSHARS